MNHDATVTASPTVVSTAGRALLAIHTIDETRLIHHNAA